MTKLPWCLPVQVTRQLVTALIIIAAWGELGCVSKARHERELRLMLIDQEALLREGRIIQDTLVVYDVRLQRLESRIAEADDRESRSRGGNRFEDSAEEAGKRTDEKFNVGSSTLGVVYPWSQIYKRRKP
jgi:hypothetical protein